LIKDLCTCIYNLQTMCSCWIICVYRYRRFMVLLKNRKYIISIFILYNYTVNFMFVSLLDWRAQLYIYCC